MPRLRDVDLSELGNLTVYTVDEENQQLRWFASPVVNRIDYEPPADDPEFMQWSVSGLRRTYVIKP